MLEELQSSSKLASPPVLKLFDTFKYVLDAYIIAEEGWKSKCSVLDREVGSLTSKLKDISRYGSNQVKLSFILAAECKWEFKPIYILICLISRNPDLYSRLSILNPKTMVLLLKKYRCIWRRSNETGRRRGWI